MAKMKSAEDSAAPETAPQAPADLGAAAPRRQVARISITAGKSVRAHGMTFVAGRFQVVANEDLIEEFKRDGNFIVEMVDAGGAPAGRK